jgi:hypothetical protein
MMMWNKTVIQSTYKKLDQLLHYIACIIYKNVQLFFKEIFLGKENEISFRIQDYFSFWHENFKIN